MLHGPSCKLRARTQSLVFFNSEFLMPSGASSLMHTGSIDCLLACMPSEVITVRLQILLPILSYRGS
jgi:hypothetical protein